MNAQHANLFPLICGGNIIGKIHPIFQPRVFSPFRNDRYDAAFNAVQYTEYTMRNFDIEILGFSRQYYAAVIYCNNYREY